MRDQVAELSMNSISDSHTATPQQTLLTGKVLAQALAAEAGEDRLLFARSFVYSILHSYWIGLQQTEEDKWPVSETPECIELTKLSASADALAERMGKAAAKLDVMEAGYLIGGTYTAMLPADVRSNLGAYYTPPALCERLLDMATEVGVNWKTCRVLDPACGGGAFLAPVARRMLKCLSDSTPVMAIRHIAHRLTGFELDPFAAWSSHVFLEASLLEACHAAGMRLPNLVKICDSLKQLPRDEGYDLVVGNPPYGRIKLSPSLRDRYRRSLFGHANLYGVFTDLALRFTRRGGVIAYVTPTSFLAGEYFKALRGLLAKEAPPASIDFVVERRGIFEDVLQETLLAGYRRGGDPAAGVAHFILPSEDGRVKTTAAGSFRIPEHPKSPWPVPRVKEHGRLIRRMQTMHQRLADYGYAVSTGPLVWNRHKSLLRDQPGEERYPLIWAESVRPDGRFEFRAEKKNHKPFFQPGPKEMWVVTNKPCVLLQRTTAKEQKKRLIAAELPNVFLDKYRAVVVENHLNMLWSKDGRPKVSGAALAALLNSDVVDQVFRCINGSVAVSAYELEALPLPEPKAMDQIEELVKRGASRQTINRVVERFYCDGGA